MSCILEITQSPPMNLEVSGVGGSVLEVIPAASPSLEPLVIQGAELAVQQTPAFELVVTLGTQGPQGPPGISEDDMAYAERTDIVSDQLIYKGQAQPGTIDSEPLWRIQRLTIGLDDDVTRQWADGDANFNKVWADRLTLNYS